jgi:gliding motility-associated-like protein
LATAPCDVNATVTVEVSERAKPVASVTQQPTCTVPTGTITITNFDSTLSYTLIDEDGDTAEAIDENGVFTELEPGDYSVRVNTDCNAVSESVTIILGVVEEIETVTGATHCYDGGTYDLFDLLVGEYDNTGTWENTNSVGTLEGSMLDLSSYEYNIDTAYTFNYVISGNCPSTTSVELIIDDSCIVLACSLDDIKKSISKAVTPNGDGFNDFFTIGVDLDCGFTFDVKIFNRWGAEIFSMRNYQNNWDGYSNKSISSSNQLPSGTYYYILEINGSGLQPIQGYIYLGTK